MPRTALGQKCLKPPNPYFAISRPWGSVRPQHKRKKIAHFLEDFFVADVFFSYKLKVPLGPGNCIFLFSARNFSKRQGAALGQKGLKTLYFAISRPWGPVGENTKCKKVAQFRGENFGAEGFFPPKVPLAGFPPQKCP